MSNKFIQIGNTDMGHYVVGQCHNHDLNNDGTYIEVLAKRESEQDSSIFLGMMVSIFTMNDVQKTFMLGRIESVVPDFSADINLKASLKDIQRHKDVSPVDVYNKIDEPYKKQSLFQNYRVKILGVCYIEDNQVKFVSNVRKLPAPISLLLGIPNSSILNKLFTEAVSQTDTNEHSSFEIGTLQYGTVPEYTNQYYNPNTANRVPIYFDVSNLLRKRTAIFGKSGYGKSNTVKTTLGMLATQYPNCGILILDTNGEYAMDNDQNDGFIDIFNEAGMKGKCTLYSQRKIHSAKISKFGADTFKTLRFDVFSNISASIDIIVSNLNGISTPLYLQAWASDVQGVDDQKALFDGHHPATRNLIWAFWFYCCLSAGLKPVNKKTQMAELTLSKEFLNIVASKLFAKEEGEEDTESDDETITNISSGNDQSILFKNCSNEQQKIILEKLDAYETFGKIKTRNIEIMASYAKWYIENKIKKAKDDEESSLKAYSHLTQNPKRLYFLKSFHLDSDHISVKGENTLSLGEKVWKDLNEQKIVIIDLASIPYSVAKVLTDQLATSILGKASNMFSDYEQYDKFKNLDIVIFIEEAQNYLSAEKIAKGSGIFERLAKEGRKFHLGLVYITQQPSAIDVSITSQTENIIAMHLSNSNDTFTLNKMKDKFDLLTCRFLKDEAQKGLAYLYAEPHQPFVLQAQIHKFSKELVLNALRSAKKNKK